MRFDSVFLLLMLAPGVVVAQTVPAQTSPTVDQMRQMLNTSERRGTLVTDGAQPFHLVASYEEFDVNGKLVSKGSLDELWAGPKRYREVITLPVMKLVSHSHGGEFEEDHHAPPAILVEVDDGNQAWRTGKWVLPMAPAVAIAAVLNPFHNLSPTTRRFSYEGDFQKNHDMECVGVEPDLTGVADDIRLALTTYCMEKGNHIVHVLSQPNAHEIVFNDIEPFGGRFIARSVSVGINGIVRAKLQVDVMEPATDFHELNEPAPGGAQLLRFHRADLPRSYLTGEVMRGQLLAGGKNLHSLVGDLHGTVVLNIHVDTTGSVAGVDVVRSSSPVLTASVVAAVKQWRFRVSYQGDRVVPVVYPLNVNF